jgi:hypothetical protein
VLTLLFAGFSVSRFIWAAPSGSIAFRDEPSDKLSGNTDAPRQLTAEKLTAAMQQMSRWEYGDVTTFMVCAGLLRNQPAIATNLT